MSWYSTSNVRYKTMKYNQSCFPCSLHIILKNLGKVAESDAIEDLWDRLQVLNGKSGLNAAAPTEDDVHRNIAQTPQLKGVGCRIISPSMLGPSLSLQILSTESASFLDQYTGMVIGIAHATVVYKLPSNRFLWVKVSPELDSTDVAEASGVRMDALSDDDGNKVVRVEGTDNEDFRIAGNFIMLLR
jgi:hypothetical protein